jgi:hypothetical protein
MNILVLHYMGPEKRWLASVADLELALPRYAPSNRYIIHNAYLPIPEFIKDIEYDAIIINATFISLLSSPSGYRKVKKNYAFIENNPAYTIALPQDDYWCSEVRDEWFTECNINKVYPVCSEEYWSLFYPRYMRLNFPMSLGYTGYITPKLRFQCASPIPYRQRKFDVVYRAKEKPFFPNRLGNIKGSIGNQFKKAFAEKQFILNISTKPSDIIHGDNWLKFVGEGRSILGSNSGSSVLVRNHEVIRKTREYMFNHPCATIDEIEQASFTNEETKHEFTAISPRNLEAGLQKTLQILTHGEYSGLLNLWEQYVPLEADCSNAKEIEIILTSYDEYKRIATNCRDALMDCSAIQIESFIDEILNAISQGLSANHVSLDAGEFLMHIQKHNRIMKCFEKLISPIRSTQVLANQLVPESWKHKLKRLLNTRSNL